MDLIHFIHRFRTPELDLFFKFLNYFDRPEFLFVLVPIIWLCIGARWGIKIFYILTLSGIINVLIKTLFAEPRPLRIDPTVGIIPIGGYSFPSGAAQTVILLSLILLTHWKTRWKWVVALCYIFFVSLSRIYLGVHFLKDVIAGWFVGFCLWLIFVYLFPIIEEKLEKMPRNALWTLTLGFPFLMAGLSLRIPFPVFEDFFSAAFGLSLGLAFSCKYHRLLGQAHKKKEFFLRSVVGVSGVFLIAALFSYFGLLWKERDLIMMNAIRNVVIGLWISALACWMFHKKSFFKKSI